MPRKRKTPSSPTPTPKKPRTSSSPRHGAGDETPERVQATHIFGGDKAKLALHLPPMHSLDDIYASITRHAMTKGLKYFLGHMNTLQRPLHVATVCSGTESPLLVLEMVKAYRYAESFDFAHLFSAEIVPFKQAYIERNFNPPLLFRDVTQLKDNFAQTAYGSLRRVPQEVDILIAGFSCVDFSALNCKRKKLDENGESGGTFMGIVNYARSHRPRMVLLENVKNCPWEEVAAYWEDLGYLATHVAVDTKDFYIPQTRVRGYMFCIDKHTLHGSDLAGIMEAWRNTFSSFKRRASSPAGMFLLDNDDRRLEQVESGMAIRIAASNPRVVADWKKYQNRHRAYREDNKLGDKRPVSKSEDHATCQMPDFAWHTWARATVERIWDTLDINFLRKLQAGYDMNFKERYLDLSQGVERETDTRPYGIIGCITPCGIPFVTTRGGPLLGMESLSLQGLPTDRLSLTRETQRELQDLAGNAMSSTVVGAAFLSALITGYKIFDRVASSAFWKQDKDTMQIVPMDKYGLVQNNVHLGTETIDIAELQAQAGQSARYCVCERQCRVKQNILVCTLCGHTACFECAHNPTHSFKLAPDLPRSPPMDFVGKLKSVLPTRLQFSGILESDYEGFKAISPCDADTWRTFLRSVMQIVGDELRFSDIRRSDTWTVVYSGRFTVLKFVIGVSAVTWLLFAKPSDTERASSLNRVILGKPVARMTPAVDSILAGDWEICAPLSSKREMTIHGAGSRVASYEYTCGLKTPEHRDSKVWSELVVTGSDESVKDLDADIRGAYTRLPYCGMANATLHKKPASADSPAVYLFLDPSKYGSPSGDMFVFSFEHARIAGYEPRVSIAEVSHTWRSSEATNYPESVHVYSRKWIKTGSAILEPYTPDAQISCRSLKPGTDISIGDVGCHHANVTIMSFTAPASTIEIVWKECPWKAPDTNHAVPQGWRFSWLVQRAAAFSDFRDWNAVENFGPLTESNAPCAACAPPKPRILWTRGTKGIKGYEHPHDAAVYERLTKAKPSPFLVFRCFDDNGFGDLSITLNIQTLLHRAYDKLVGQRVDNSASFSWRLVPNAYDSKAPLPKFTLTGNQGGNQSQPTRFKVELRPEQQRSLFWMMSQEDGISLFEQEEIEEAFLPWTMWRAEGRVTVHKQVRGGVLADEVGYGKTAIVLALIAAKYDVAEPGPCNNLIPSKATLIIVPEVVITQWRGEIEKFMDITREDVLVLPDVATLAKKKVQTIREARIILVPSSLLSNQSYYQKMNDFTGMPQVPARPGRNFDHWFKDAQEYLKDHVQILMSKGPLKLLDAIHAKREEVNNNQTNCTYEPSKRLRGQKYTEAQKRKLGEVYDILGAEGEEPDRSKVRMDRRGRSTGRVKNSRQEFNIDRTQVQDLDDVQIPLLHAFSFTRLVMDEFTYADQDRLVTLFALQAGSTWILSGTPPLNDFADVNTIAPFFGIHLGVADGELNPRSKRPKHELGVENFESFKEPHSVTWHLNRHNVAQRFLSQFVRRNVAEIDEIPFTEHVVLVDQLPVETALYLELHMRLMAQKDQYRRIGKIMYSDDRLQRMKDIINTSKSPKEALIKRGSYLASHGGWTERQDVTLESLIALRKAEVDRFQDLFREKLWLANRIYFHQELNGDRYQNFIADVFQNRFGNETLDIDVFQVIKQSLFGSQENVAQEDDWKRHLTNRSTDANRGIESIEHRQSESGPSDSSFEDGSESEISSDDGDIPRKPGTLSEFESASRKAIGAMRSLMRKWVRQAGTLRFLESIRLVQFSTDIPCCSCCTGQPEALGSINVLGSCGHILCEECTLATEHSEECSVDGCTASGKEHQVINGEEIGRWKAECDSDSQQCSKYGGSKMDRLVEIIQRTPEEDRVLLFIQFPDAADLACRALEAAEIKHQRVTAAKHALFQQQEKFLAELKQHKVLILSLGTDNAAGLNLQHTNHVIFLSPMLCDTQYNYESSMCQAIGRARRYGQSKHVHVYHLLAKRTIDVSIYQGEKILIERDGQGMLVSHDEASLDELNSCQGPAFEEYQKE